MNSNKIPINQVSFGVTTDIMCRGNEENAITKGENFIYKKIALRKI